MMYKLIAMMAMMMKTREHKSYVHCTYVDHKDGGDAVHKSHVQVGHDYHVMNGDDENKT